MRWEYLPHKGEKEPWIHVADYEPGIRHFSIIMADGIEGWLPSFTMHVANPTPFTVIEGEVY